LRTVLVTGSRGTVARLVVPLLEQRGYTLRLADRAGTGAEQVGLRDADACARAVAGVDGIVHLAGAAKEASLESLVADNAVALGHLLAAASRAGVPHFVLASSMHVMARHVHELRMRPRSGGAVPGAYSLQFAIATWSRCTYPSLAAAMTSSPPSPWLEKKAACARPRTGACSGAVVFRRVFSSAVARVHSRGCSRTVEAVAYGALISLSACSGSVQPVEQVPPATTPTPAPTPSPEASPAPPGTAPLPVTVTLSWQAPQTRVDGSLLQNLTGYRVRYGTSPGTYTTVLEVSSGGVTELALSGLMPGPYWFVVTATDADGLESGYSNEATTIVR
jgi:NAD(P)-dependent dehydrogenase (short-subunit alcohol dehydrogenase family)